MSGVILRKFWLENETGAVRPLNGENGIWLMNPTGLGTSTDNDYVDYRNGFYKLATSNKDPQQTVAGDLYFLGDNPYEMYLSFMDWVYKSSELYLVYMPASIQFKRKIVLKSITKTELKTQQCLCAPVAMLGLTPWFNYELFEVEENTFNYENLFRVDNSISGRVDQSILAESSRYEASYEFIAHGQLPAAFKIIYKGFLDNPAVSVYTVNSGTLIGQCWLDGLRIDASGAFEYSTLYDDSHVIAITGSGVKSNLAGYLSDLTTEVYPRLPVTEPVRITLSSDSDFKAKATIEIWYYYKGV